MLSASYARLGSELSGLKLQAIISGQIDANNCLEWGEKISKADYFDEIKSVYPIHDRLIKGKRPIRGCIEISGCCM